MAWNKEANIRGPQGVKGATGSRGLQGPQGPPGEDAAFNVKSYGAVGNNVHDDSPAFQSALNAINAAGGGTLFVPPGHYFCSTRFRVYSNTNVLGFGATLQKRGGQTLSPDYDFFNVVSDGKTGFGSGAKNISFKGITFQGNFSNTSDYRAGCGFSLHHAQNVVIEQCTFIELQAGGHCIDLGGCDHVTIRDCDFIGFDPYTPNNNHAEAIQIDQSAEGSLSSPDAAGSFDGLKTKNVTISNCRFLPLTVHGTTFPSPNPLGSHAMGDDNKWYENIIFQNNYIEDSVDDLTTYQYKGTIHFTHARNVSIKDNTFTRSKKLENKVIGFYTNSSRLNMAPNNIEITGNTFHNCLSDVNANAEMTIHFAGLSGGEIRGVRIRGNEFTQDLPIVGADYDIRPEWVVDLKSTDNVFSNTNNCGYMPNNTNSIWTGNTFTNSEAAPIFFGPTNGLTFTGNVIKDCRDGLNFTDVTNGTVTGNSIVASAQPGIKVNRGMNISIQSNTVVAGGTETTNGIDIYGESTNVHAINNTVTGFNNRAASRSTGSNVHTTPNY